MRRERTSPAIGKSRLTGSVHCPSGSVPGFRILPGSIARTVRTKVAVESLPFHPEMIEGCDCVEKTRRPRGKTKKTGVTQDESRSSYPVACLAARSRGMSMATINISPPRCGEAGAGESQLRIETMDWNSAPSTPRHRPGKRRQQDPVRRLPVAEVEAPPVERLDVVVVRFSLRSTRASSFDWYRTHFSE